MNDDLVDQIINNAIENAFNEKCCATCKFAYLNYMTGTGYCKHAPKRKRFTVPKNITENSVCNHWKKKEI